MEERAKAGAAARALRAALADHASIGARSVMHIDFCRPKRGAWIATWANVPGFKRVNGAYQHDCLPGWSYTRAEIKSEMISDLEALAERGVRPIEATSAA